MEPLVSGGRQTGTDSGLTSCFPDSAKATEPYLSSAVNFQEAERGYDSSADVRAATAETAPPTSLPLGCQLPHSRHAPTLTAPAVGCTSSPFFMHSSDSYHSGKHFAWPSPPLGPGDFDSIAQHQLPASNQMPSSYPDTPTPSVTWQSSAGSLYHPSPTSGEIYQPDPMPSLAACTPTTPLYTLPSEGASAFPDFGSQVYSPTGDTGDLTIQQAHLPIAAGNSIQDGADMASSAMATDGYVTHPFGMPATPESLSIAPKSDEPYAKLIFRALMSKGDHRMTLQEIYQWFRDNTSKADGDKDKKGGWQNSIRHNLSMNAAFVKPDQKDDGGESKRSNVWVLEPWAVKTGVISTTRYRSNLARRSAHRSSSQQLDGNGRPGPGPYSSIRSQSGRRGGCATRNARLRGQLYHQQSLSAELPQYAMMFGHPISPPRSVVLSNALPDGLLGSGATLQASPTSYGYSNSPGFASAPADVYMSDPNMGHNLAVGGEVEGLHARFDAGPGTAAAAAAASTPATYFGAHLNYVGGTGNAGGVDDQYNSRHGHAEYDPHGQLVAAATNTSSNSLDGDGLCDWRGGM